MTVPTASVSIRRLNYNNLAKPLTAVSYDDQYDNSQADVLDPVLRDNNQWTITGYHWDIDQAKQVAD
jgi:hypothetical protein